MKWIRLYNTNQIHYQCEECGHIKIRKLSIKDIFINAILSFALVFGFSFMFMVGFMFTPVGKPFFNMALESFDYESLRQNYASHQQDDLARTYGINLTQDCYKECSSYYYKGDEIELCGYPEYCVARDTYYGVARDFQYMLDANTIYSTEHLLETKRSECENYAVLYCKILYNLGIKCNVKCSTYHKHCISIVTTRKHGKFIVDLTDKITGFQPFPENTTINWG